MTLTPTPRLLRTATLIASATAVAALSACGGGSDDNNSSTTTTRAALTGAAGELVAMGPDLLASGTYTVSECVTYGTSTEVRRKIRLNDDGSLQWLDASNNDAVLASYTPSTTDRDYRQFSLEADGEYALQAAVYIDVPADTAQPGAAGRVQAQRLATQSTTRVSFSVQPDRIYVTTNTGLTEDCRVGNVNAQSNATTVVTIPVVLDDTIAARRLGSAVSLNNQANGLSTDESVGYYTGSTIVQERIVRSISNAGQITSTVDTQAATPWGNWIATLKTTPGNRGAYSETYSAVNSTGVNSPSNPGVNAELVHPTLTYGGGRYSIFLSLSRNTSGSGAPVILDLMSDAK